MTTTPSECPVCGHAVHGVDIQPGAAAEGTGKVPGPTDYIFLPCGHPAVSEAE